MGVNVFDANEAHGGVEQSAGIRLVFNLIGEERD